MYRILRAFAWMRWRVVVNALERTAARDTIQRFSLAAEQIGPLLALALFIPSALSLAGIAGYAGYALASSPPGTVLVFEVLRFVLLFAVAFSIVGPIILPAGERTNAVRLLLLPIPGPVLYVAQAASAFADPWILLVIPIVVALPLGLAAGGAIAATLVTLVAGVVLLVVLVGLSTVSTIVLHVAMRDRRRAELLALTFVLVLPLLGALPGLIQLAPEAGDRHVFPGWARSAGAHAFAASPSELFRRAITASVQGDDTAAAAALGGLLVMAAALHALGLTASVRLLANPGSSSTRRAAGRHSAHVLTVPGLSPGASAVAVNQVRLGVRTPRGRSILISPIFLFAMFTVVMWRSGSGMDLGFVQLESGLALAAFGGAACLLAILPFSLNQFAIDGAGLTMEFLSPLSDIDILVGKAVGTGLLALAPATFCVVAAALVFPGGSAALWLSVPLALAATYMLAAPAAAATSATFPRAVDLNSIGNRSNAHGLAALVGIAAFAAAAVPPVFLVLLAMSGLRRPALAPISLLIWCAAAALICRVLLGFVARLFQARRENLALIV